MAFQVVPTANIASITADIWPSMRSTLSLPWKSLGRKPEAKPGHERSMSTASWRREDNTQVSSQPTFDLPECLISVPIQSLRQKGLPQNRALEHGSSARPIFPNHILRAASPYSNRIPAIARSYSTSPLSRPIAKKNPRQSVVLAPIQRRTIFGMGTPSQTLLINMEQTANNNPSSASAQNAFYSALMRANMPQIVVERFQKGQYASNKACEETYQRALDMVAKSEGGAQGGLQGAAASQLSEAQLREIVSSSAARTGSLLTQNRFAKVQGGTGEKANPIHVMVDEPRRSTLLKWVKFIVGYGLAGYFVLVILTVAVETSGILRKSAVQNAEAQAQQQTVRFSDVHGCDEAKEELQELVEFLKNPERFSTLGGKLPKGVLMVGPPGTGKTLLARAVAGEADVPFLYMSGSEFDEMYVGVGAKRVRELFASARAKAPAIIFIDELDAVGTKRNERDPTYVKQTLNQILTELDGFTQDTGVIILGATNFPELLDKALTRPGRFDRNVEVPLPDVRGRMKILQHYMKKIKVDTDIETEMIARGTPGFSGAELESLVNQAAVHASKNRTSTVGMLDLEWAKDKIMMGAERRSFVMQDKDKLMTAYHEAGHALVGMYTNSATPIYKVTIMPRGRALGVTHFLPEMDKISQGKSELFASLDVAMGGKAAEEIVYGDDSVTSGCSSDLNNATSVAFRMVTQYGMSPTLGNIDFDSIYRHLSSETRLTIESEVKAMIEAAHKRAIALLQSKRSELDMLAKALVEYEVLSKDEIRKVLKGEKLNKLTGLRGGSIKVPELVLPPGMADIGALTGQSADVGGKAELDDEPAPRLKGQTAMPDEERAGAAKRKSREEVVGDGNDVEGRPWPTEKAGED